MSALSFIQAQEVLLHRPGRPHAVLTLSRGELRQSLRKDPGAVGGRGRRYLAYVAAGRLAVHAFDFAILQLGWKLTGCEVR